MKAKAFPSLDVKFVEPYKTEYKYSDRGMELRDYFAAHATQADVHHWQVRIAEELNREKREKGKYSFDSRTQARHVPRELAKYRYADQMVKAKINQV